MIDLVQMTPQHPVRWANQQLVHFQLVPTVSPAGLEGIEYHPERQMVMLRFQSGNCVVPMSNVSNMMAKDDPIFEKNPHLGARKSLISLPPTINPLASDPQPFDQTVSPLDMPQASEVAPESIFEPPQGDDVGEEIETAQNQSSEEILQDSTPEFCECDIKHHWARKTCGTCDLPIKRAPK